MDGKTENVSDAICDGAIIRSMVAFERVDFGINLLIISIVACVGDEDSQLNRVFPFEFSVERDQELSLAFKSPVTILFSFFCNMRSKISKGIRSCGGE